MRVPNFTSFGWGRADDGAIHVDVLPVRLYGLGDVTWEVARRIAPPGMTLGPEGQVRVERERNSYFAREPESHFYPTGVEEVLPAISHVILTGCTREGVVEDAGPHDVDLGDHRTPLDIEYRTWRSPEPVVVMADFERQARANTAARALREAERSMQVAVHALDCGLFRVRARAEIADPMAAVRLAARVRERLAAAGGLTSYHDLWRRMRILRPPPPPPVPPEVSSESHRVALPHRGGAVRIVLSSHTDGRRRARFFYEGPEQAGERAMIIYASCVRDHGGRCTTSEALDREVIECDALAADVDLARATLRPKSPRAGLGSVSGAFDAAACQTPHWVLTADYGNPLIRRSVRLEFDLDALVVWYFEEIVIRDG